MTVLLYFVAREILVSNFNRLEEKEAKNNITRVLKYYEYEMEFLAAQTRDWAVWDDTYQFMQQPDIRYINSNLTEDTFHNLSINMILLLNTKGEIVLSKGYDLEQNRIVPVSVDIQKYLITGSPLLDAININSGTTGIVMLSGSPMMLAAHPILKSDGQGPASGIFIMGRYIDSALVAKIGEMTGLNVTVTQVSDNNVEEYPANLVPGQIYVRPIDENNLSSYTLITDIMQQPILVVITTMYRELYLQSRTITMYLIAMLVTADILTGAAILFLMDTQVLEKIASLSRNLRQIASTGDISQRIQVSGRDEIASLSSTVNSLLSSIQNIQEELQKSESQYRIITENIRDGLLILKDWKPVYFNTRIPEILGHTPEEIMSLDLMDFIHHEDRSRVRQKIEEYLKIQPEYIEEHLRILRKDGNIRLLECNFTFLHGEGGKRLLCVVSDITERHKLEEDLRTAAYKWRTTFDGIGEAICLIDSKGKILQCNQAFANVIDRPFMEIVNKDCREILFKDIQGATCPIEKITLNRRRDTQTFLYKNRWFEMNTDPILDDQNNLEGATLILSDITESKDANEKLRAAYIKETELRQKLEMEIQRRIEFTRALVHELKTPLTPILASSELMVEELQEEPWASLSKNIYSGAQNLNRRIDELLDLARGEIGMLKLNIQPVDVTRLYQDIVEFMTPSASTNQLTLEAQIPELPVIQADEDRLRQILLNLIGNAIKYTPAGGRIYLIAYVENSNLITAVSDTGEGLSEEEQSRLFQPYHRIVSDRQRFSGLGLGLVLAKQLVELHGGSMWLKSIKGRGSTFYFSLPLRQDNHEEPSNH